jgi:hypothetical protein
MPKAGWCTSCGGYAWVCSDGACELGHASASVQGVYEAQPDPATGRPLAPVTQSTSTVSPGWYNDPSGVSRLRYWDGQAWTERVSPVAQPGVAPLPSPATRRRRWVLAGLLGTGAWLVFELLVAYVVGSMTGHGRDAGYVAGRLFPAGTVIVWIVAAIWGLSARKSG